MKRMEILRGLPASGKSTYAKALTDHVRVNRDDIRAMLGVDHAQEELVRSMRDHCVREALYAGKSVVVDDTNLIPKTVKHLHSIAEQVGGVEVHEVPFNTPLVDCLARNAARPAPVPEHVIRSMAKAAKIDKGKLLEPKVAVYPERKFEAAQQDASLPTAIICDLDGTLAHIGDRSPYDASNCHVVDTPNEPVVELIKNFYWADTGIIFMSGREDKHREPTEKFIKRCLYEMRYQLFMRATGDMRRDAIVKRELFDAHVRGRYNVLFVVDDRPQVVRMWRYELGLTVFALDDREF